MSRQACRTKLRQVPRRTYATQTSLPSSQPQLSTSLIINRHPLLSPKPPHFAQSYYNYQFRLHRALATPFPQHFYFKKGTALQQRFHNEEIDRDRHLLGSGFGKGARLRLPPEPYDKPLSRTHEADLKNDTKSLDRSGDRNLYLLVKKGQEAKGVWRLPQAVAPIGQALHEAARNQILSQCGENIDTWIVGRQPVGFLEDSDKVFFFKAHVFAGQVTPNPSDIDDFAWLTKQEIAERVDGKYFDAVKDMLDEV